MVKAFILSFSTGRGVCVKSLSIFGIYQGLVLGSAGCGERENILSPPSSYFFFSFLSILLQHFQLVTRQVVVNWLARWCCLTSARETPFRNREGKFGKEGEREEIGRGRESSRQDKAIIWKPIVSLHKWPFFLNFFFYIVFSLHCFLLPGIAEIYDTFGVMIIFVSLLKYDGESETLRLKNVFFLCT